MIVEFHCVEPLWLSVFELFCTQCPVFQEQFIEHLVFGEASETNLVSEL